MKVTINLPDKISHRETHIVSMETDSTGLKARLEKQWRKHLRRYRPLVVPINCEFCAHVGEAQWHCHNKESKQCHLNVMPSDVCTQWSPNQGLLMFLSGRLFDQQMVEWERARRSAHVGQKS